MSQHPKPVGPTNNIAAAFSPEMVAGSTPVRSPVAAAWKPVPVGWITSQTTHVQAPFTPDMITGEKPTRPRPSTFLVASEKDLQIPPPDVPSFSIEMIRGYRPDKPVLFLPVRVGLQTPYSPHLAAPFSIEMVMADRGSRLRPMNYLPPPDRDLQVPPPDVFAFSPEMVQGYRPDRPVLFLPLRTGQQLTYSQHLAAPFTVDMISADRPQRSGVMRPLLAAPEKDSQILPPEVTSFSVEQAIGYHPDSPRLFTIIPHLGIVVSQTTHVNAPFTPDMVVGSRPDRNRELLPLRVGTRLWISDIVTLSPDMTIGYHPDQPQLRRGNQTGQSVVPVSIEFFAEFIRGYHPDRPVLTKGVQAFMFAPPDVVAFANETVIGYHPDSPRILMPLRTGRSVVDAAIHTAAAFGIEMVTGSKPDKNRILFTTRHHIDTLVYAIPSNIVIPLVIRMTADGFSVSTLDGETFTFTRLTTDTWLGSN